MGAIPVTHGDLMFTGVAAAMLNETGMENSTQRGTVVLDEPQWVPRDTVIGLILAFSSCLFIGVSVIFKKLALRDIEVSDE